MLRDAVVRGGKQANSLVESGVKTLSMGAFDMVFSFNIYLIDFY
ncbi:hypothetical protein D781_2262 [Serratia sp. FGI94]|nr:hypothetical protein D781_2262 [Serratia sp. FGI94]